MSVSGVLDISPVFAYCLVELLARLDILIGSIKLHPGAINLS
jgi:hypothetical protein